MNRTVCQYAIIRFLPFIETGEFANVGIAMIAAKGSYFGFKLQPARRTRVTAFFEKLDTKVFRAAMNDIDLELTRVNHLLNHNGNNTNFARTLFNEVVRQREVMVRFSETRTVLSKDPAQTLNELYEYYVERGFVTKEYNDALMEKGLRKLLVNADLGKKFVRHKLGNEDFHVAFPFVALTGDKATAIIKPLNLSDKDPTKIRERGNNWQYKVNELKRREFLPRHVLFAIDGPHDDKNRKVAFEDAKQMLLETGVTVLPIDREKEILEFAIAQAHNW